MPVRLHQRAGFNLWLTDPWVELQGEALHTQMFHTWKNLEDLWIGLALAPSHRTLAKDASSEICMHTVGLETTYHLLSLI